MYTNTIYKAYIRGILSTPTFSFSYISFLIIFSSQVTEAHMMEYLPEEMRHVQSGCR